MKAAGPLPLWAVLNAALVGIVLQWCALLMTGSADLFSWISGSSMVALVTWAVGESSDGFSSKVLETVALSSLKGRTRAAIVLGLATLAAYLILLPTLTIQCDRRGKVTIAARTVIERHCEPKQTVVLLPQGAVPSWRPEIKVTDSARRFSYLQLAALSSNVIRVPTDLAAPTAALLQLTADQSASLDTAAGPGRVQEGCSNARFCARIDGLGSFAVTKNGLLIGRKSASSDLLAKRYHVLQRSGLKVLEPGEPFYLETDALDDVTELTGRLEAKIGDSTTCTRFTCTLEPEKENLCVLVPLDSC